MNLYEYKIIRKSWTLIEDCPEETVDAYVGDYLNTIGIEGWELINYDVELEYNGVRDITTRFSIFGIAKRLKQGEPFNKYPYLIPDVT